ncbi:MAG TPA: DUF6356 family protein [Stellaceae bacterium]|nr:DUF6356 family protein [Stellaceae bacterium]
MKVSFSEHPASVGESYIEHLQKASGFAFSMIRGGIACLVHAVLPFLFTHTGSGVIRSLHDKMVVNRRAQMVPSRRQRSVPQRSNRVRAA